MTARSYRIEDFVQDMTALLERVPDQQELFDRGSSYLERLVRNPDCIPPQYLKPIDRGGGRYHGTYLLHRGEDGLSVTAVVWGPGDHAAPHDHHTWGMIGVLENSLAETRFRRLDDRSNPEYARLEKDRVMDNRPGEVTLLIPDVDEIHQMDNLTDRPTVEIHVYGRDLLGLERCRFDPETGRVSSFVTAKYDN